MTGHQPPVSYPVPRRGEVVRDAERYLRQALAVLARPCDPASDPSAEDDPHGLGYVEIRTLAAIADVRSALRMLSEITDYGLPPAGSAVTQDPARQLDTK